MAASRTIANLHAALSWDLDDFDRGTSHIEGGFRKLRTLVIGVGDAFVAQGKRMSLGVTLPSAAFAGFAVKAASDAQELQSAFEQSFGAMAKRVDAWAEQTGNALDRSTTEMKDGALAFNQLFSKAAPTQEAAANLSEQFTELAQNAASFFNTDFDTALGKIRSGLSGESEPLRDFGVFINETAVKNKALEMGLIKTGQELNEYGKIMARSALIAEGLSVVNGDIERTGGELANMWRGLKSDLQELSEYMGQKFLPYAKQIVSWARSAVTWFKNLPEPVHNFIVVMGIAAAAMGPLILAMTTLAVVLLPLFVARFGPVLLLLSAILNPVGTAIVLLAKFAAGFGFSMAILRSFAGMLLRTLGPLGLLISAILLFKDDIVEAFRAIWREAGINLGEPLQELFGALIRISAEVRKALSAIIDSDLGKEIGEFIGFLGDLLSILLQIGGFVVIKSIEGLISVLIGLAEYVVGVVTTIRKLFEGDWAGAWDAATAVVGNAITRIAGWIENLFPTLSMLLKMIGQIIGTADFLNNNSPLGGAVSGAVGTFWDAFDQASGNKGTGDFTGGDYAVPGSGDKKKKGRGRSGPTKEELADRREEIRLAQLLAVAREKGDLETERTLQRQIDLRSKIKGYVDAGLSKQAASTAAEKDMLEIDEARAIANARSLAIHERAIDVQLGELRNDYQLLKTLEDEEFLEKRILFYREQEIDLLNATRRAQEDLLHLETARTEQTARRLADQEREHQIELARIRGDDPSRIYQMQESLRRDDRIDDLRRNGLSEADAIAQATQEGMERSRAHLQGTFRDTFRDGLRAAMDGNLGQFIKNFWQDKLFDVFSRVLDRFADNLASMMSGGGGGGGLLGSIGKIAGVAGSALGFLGGNTVGAMGAKSVASLQSTFVPKFAGGGSFRIKGFSGVDQNMLSLNGNPIAKVSSGEIMDVRQGGQAASGGGVVEIRLKDDMLDARIISGSVNVVRTAAPQIRDSAVGEVLRRSGRPSL